MSDRIYVQIANVLESVFADVVKNYIDWYLFDRVQTAADSLYQVSRQSEKTYTAYSKVEAFVALSVSDIDVQVYGNIISDADLKLIIRSEELKRLNLWHSTYDKSLLTNQDRIGYNGEFYNVVKVSDKGKLQAKFLITMIFAKRDIER